MRISQVIAGYLVFIFLGGCRSLFGPAPPVESYVTESITNSQTRQMYSCNRPINSFVTKNDLTATLKLAYDVQAKLKSGAATAGSKGELGGQFKHTLETVNKISESDFHMMNVLYPLCKAHAEGSMTDADYSKKLQEIIATFVQDHAALVRIDRTADFSGSGCVGGKRVYKNLMKDSLTFSKPVKEYEAQAWTNPVGGSHEVTVTYIVDGKEALPILRTQQTLSDWERNSVTIIVNSNHLEVTYAFEQAPDLDDEQWGLSFVSSLPISSIYASVKLPPGKKVTGFDESNDAKKANSAFNGCSFVPGDSPQLICPKQMNTSPNVPSRLLWKWDVFKDCSITKTKA